MASVRGCANAGFADASLMYLSIWGWYASRVVATVPSRGVEPVGHSRLLQCVMAVRMREEMTQPSYIHGASSAPLLGETIGENLRRTVERHGDRDALVVPFQSFRATYREFWDLTGRAARGLMARAVRRGDRVGIWSPNRYEWTVIQYATARIGAVLVNINPAYKTAELESALKQPRTSYLVLARPFRT